MKFTNVYIKNFGEDYSDDKLKEVFSAFGKKSKMTGGNEATGATLGLSVEVKFIFIGLFNIRDQPLIIVRLIPQGGH